MTKSLRLAQERSVERDAPVPRIAPEVPDLYVPDEALVWKSDYYLRVVLAVPQVHPKFIGRLAHELTAGIDGRGMAGVTRNGLLKIVFGVTEGERTETFLTQYVEAVIAYIGSPTTVVRYAAIDRLDAPDDLRERVESGLRALGLRALKPAD